MRQLALGIVAHVDSGKTTLSESMLYECGQIRKLGRVDNKDTFLDTDSLEKERGITIFSKQAVFSLGDKRVTLVDTPGHVDFSTEMERSLQVLDYAVLVVSGADGVQGHTETLWKLLKRYEIPVFLFLNKMDQQGTDKAERLLELQTELDENCVDFSFEGEEGREEFYDRLAMCDESMMEEYLEHGMVKDETITDAIRNRKVFPCYAGSALKQTGVREFLEGLDRYTVCPEYPPEFGARIFKITRDEKGSRLTHMKITGGSLKTKQVIPADEGEDEKINQIRIYNGARFESVPEAEAGTICAVTGLSGTKAGQGLGTETRTTTPVLEPVLTYRLDFPWGTDLHKMLKDLRTLEEEDPMLHIAWQEESGEIHAQVMGDIQMEILKSRVKERFGVDVEFGAGNIVYKETIAQNVEGVGHYEPLRHYAEVHLLMEPGERGSGLQIAASCSEDELDRNWQRLILTHLTEKPYRGVLTGSEITDMKITLVAGRAHMKHTEGGDFRQATYRAVRQGLREAGCRLLEPVYEFSLEVPTENLGRAMADLDRMQGRFDPPVQNGEMSVLKGSAPVVTMRDYQREVISYTRGRGKLKISLRGYELCHNEEEAVAASGYDFDLDLDDPAASVFCAHGAGFVVPWNEVKDYMHVESRYLKKREPEVTKPVEPPVTRQKKAKDSYSAAYALDKELEEIFVRTYGESKRKTFTNDNAKRVITGTAAPKTEKKQPPKKVEKGEEYLLVDGYNIIFAWEELKEMAEINIEAARMKLLDILCNYQGYQKCTLIVVFDAYKVSGGVEEVFPYHNINVVYTREAETADQYIEKLACKMGRTSKVTVATSDGVVQLIIRGQGCELLSARDFLEEVIRVSTEIREELEKPRIQGKNYLLSHADEETAAYLEEIRLGKEEKKKKK